MIGTKEACELSHLDWAHTQRMRERMAAFLKADDGRVAETISRLAKSGVRSSVAAMFAKRSRQ